MLRRLGRNIGRLERLGFDQRAGKGFDLLVLQVNALAQRLQPSFGGARTRRYKTFGRVCWLLRWTRTGVTRCVIPKALLADS